MSYDAGGTLFVTVLANFLMWLRLPFSQRMPEYITNILIPSLFLGRYLEPVAEVLAALRSAAVRLRGSGVAGVLDLEVAEFGCGVRASEVG